MSNKVKIILVIVGLLIVAAVGYYFYNKSKKAKEADQKLKEAVASKDKEAVISAVKATPSITGVAEAAVLDLASSRPE